MEPNCNLDEAIRRRLAEIDAIQKEMMETYEGCDWCCGGSDEMWDDLEEEKRQLLGK
jgi:Fe-S oxidoreductase